MKLLKIGFIVFTISLLAIFLSVGQYYNTLSGSSPLDYFILEVILFSFITSILFVFIYIILRKIKNKYISLSIQLIFLNSILFFCNYSLYVTYHASWSTYTFESILFSVVLESLVPLTISSILIILVMKNYVTS